ncbi:MAG TPA: hypothetical protein VGC40_10420 [Paenirhodobacter sp.]
MSGLTPVSVEEILALVGRVLEIAPEAVSPIGAGILVAVGRGVVTNSIRFAQLLGVAHALVLRECVALQQAGLIVITRRDERTQRLFLDLTPAGQDLVARAG